MEKHILKTLKMLAALALLSLIVFFTKDELINLKEKLQETSIYSIIFISILFIISQLVNGYMLKMYVKIFGVSLKFWEWFGLTSIQSFGNYLPMSAGLASNGAYLKLKKDLDISKFLSYIAGDTVIKFLTYGLIGMSFLIFDYFKNGEFLITIFAFLLFILFVSIVAIFYKGFNGKYKITQWILSVQSGWMMIRNNNKVVLLSSLFHIINLILISLQFYIVFIEINQEIKLTTIILLTILTNLIRIASIFPGNLGLRESVSGYVSNAYNLTFSVGFVAAVVTRAISMIWVFFFGILFTFYFAKENK